MSNPVRFILGLTLILLSLAVVQEHRSAESWRHAYEANRAYSPKVCGWTKDMLIREAVQEFMKQCPSLDTGSRAR